MIMAGNTRPVPILSAAVRHRRQIPTGGAVAHEVQSDGSGAASGATWFDRPTAGMRTARARLVFMAASALESAGILMMSRSARHPDGLGGGLHAGRAYVAFGQADRHAGGFDFSAIGTGFVGFAIIGEAAGDAAGRAVSGAGDVSGDGIDELVIGAPNADGPGNSRSTRAPPMFCSAAQRRSTRRSTWPPSRVDSGGFVLYGVPAGDIAGFSVGRAGDIAGDGFDDLAIAALDADGPSVAPPGRRDAERRGCLRAAWRKPRLGCCHRPRGTPDAATLWGVSATTHALNWVEKYPSGDGRQVQSGWRNSLLMMASSAALSGRSW